MEEELLKEYVSTYLNPKYNSDWDVVNSKFPELSGVDKGLLKEYVATYLNPKYNSDWNVVNSKFPELFPVGKSSAERPVAEVKKKGDTVVPFVDGGSELTRFDPASGQVVQETPEFTKPKEKDFSGLEVKVQDEKILTKQPRVERPIVSSESTKADPDQIDFDGKLAKQKVSAPMSYSNIFAKTISDLPSDIGESWAVASAFIERQLGKAGVPGANPNLTARDLHSYNLANDWRKYTNEVFPTNQEDRSTFLGGVVSGLGQAVPMVMSGGISSVSKLKAAMDIAKTALNTGTKLTPFINMGKDIAKQAASPSGLIGGSQMSSAMYRQAIDSGATEDQAQQYAIENFFVGTVAESLPIQSMFSRILKKEPTANILRILKEGGVGAGEELTTEMWQATYENWSAQRIYDFNREMLDGVGEAGAVGGTVGFILNTALAALVGRRARVKTKEEEVILDKSIDEVKSKINTVNTNNENISSVAEELESIEPIVLNYGDSKYFFARDKSGRMELAEEPMLEDQAKSMSNMLGKVYKGLEFSIEEVMSDDPYIPVKYNVIANEKINKQQDAIQEQAAGQVPVQSEATVSQGVEQGVSQAEPQGVTQEGIQEQIAEEDIALSGLRDGFRAVTRNSFDVRSDADVMQKVGSKKSFATSVTRKGKKYLVVGLKLNEDVGATTSGRDGYSFATIEDNGNLPSNAVDVLTQKAVSNISSVYPNIKTPTIDLFNPIEAQAQEVIPASIQPDVDKINAARKKELDEFKGPLDQQFYIGQEEGPTVEEFINQKYDAQINNLKAKSATQEEIDLETQLAEDLNLIKSETKPRLRVEGIDIPAEEDINLETIEANLDRLPVYEAKFTTPTVSQDIQVNPLEESKSSTKEGTAESRTIESFDGIPMIVGMSDTLSAGTVTDALGNTMETEGGLLYNVLGKNKNAAWAGVTENGATTQYQEALDTYNKNKDLFEKLWAEGRLPNGHVPMAIMRMSDTSINSNEAVFRYLAPLVKSQPEANQKAALSALKSDIESKKISNKENLIEFISKNNIDSLGKLFDAVVADAKARAKGDLDNTLSLTDRSNLFDLMVSPQGIESASKNPVKELFGSNKDPKAKAFLADTIYDAIGEPAMLRIPRGNIAAVVGIDVLNGGVIPVEHGNYGFGPKGQMIALISNPKHGLDVFPEWKAKAVRIFKKTEPKNKEGKLPTETEIADQVGGAFFMDKAFRNARVAISPTDVDILAAKLRFAFPDVTVSRTQEEFDNVLNQEGVRTQKSGGVTILGLTKDGKIYLNPNSDSLATPIHEFGHIWIDFLRSKASGKKGDSLLAKGLSLVEGTNALKKAIEKYGDNPIAREEALVELMATKGETIINKSKKKQFTNWLNSLFKYVKEFFTTSEKFFKGTDFEQRLKEITLDDFINIGLADLLKGEPISSKFKAKDAAALPKARSSKAQRLAPNGKPSNLSEAQWNQVRTPEFKKWFGDWENDPENASKVVDENGEPLVMYHGSPSVDIESFDINKAVRQKSGLREFANYFTSNKKLADLYRKAPLSKEYKNEIENLLREAKEKQSESRSNATWDFYAQEIDRLNSLFEGKIYEVFLNVKSPFEFNGEKLDMKGWDNASLNIGYKTVSGKAGLIEALSGNNSAYDNTQYDGVIATDLADMFYGTTDKNETKGAVKDLTGTVVAIWDAKQIKSATENVGAFDTGTSNIRFRIGDNVQSFINKARAQGYSEDAIKNVLTRSGVDTDAIDTALGKKVPVKEGVPELFKDSPELASIGTTEDYSAYLDTIFPDSEVNNIVYHGSNYKFDNFKKAVNPKNVYKEGAYKAGFFFSKDKETAKSYIDNKIIAKISNALNLSSPKNPTVYPVVLDIKNPVIEDRDGKRGIGFDDVNEAYDNRNDAYIAENVKDPNILTDVYIVFNPEQIHILGSKKDIEDFKNFVSSRPTLSAAKKVEVTEEFAPGYDRMIAELEGVVEKSLKRGTTQVRAMENAINYLQGTKVYENATDVQREQMVRDVNKRFKKREKRAPTAEKIVGKPKKKEVTIDEMAALKDQIKLEARAAREAKGDLNTKRKMIADAINKLATEGKITTKKAEAIVKRASRLNVDSEVSVNKFIDYVSKVFADAEYASKLSTGNALRNKIKSVSKNKDKAANLRDLGIKFSEIDPSMVEDIEQYNTIAKKIFESINGSTLKGGVKFADIVKVSDVSDYINDAIEKQNKEILNNKIAEMSELLGIEITEDEYFMLMESINNDEALPKKYKDGAIRKAINKAFDVYSAIIDQMVDTGVDPITGEDISIDDSKKKVVRQFMDMDLNILSDKEALAAIDSLLNFIQNGSTAKMDAVYSRNLGEQKAIKLDKKNFKSSKIKKYFSESLGQFLVEQFTPLDIVMERMFKGVQKAGDFMFESGISALKKGKSIAQSLNNKIVDKYYNTFYKTKPNNQDFNTVFNTVERAMTAHMMRTMPGTESEINTEFKKKKSLLEQSIVNLKKGNDKHKKLADIYTEVYDKLVKDSDNYDDVVNKADPKNVEAVGFWQNEWANKYGALSDLSESIYNKTLGRDLNYTPLKVSSIGKEQGIDDNSDEINKSVMSFHSNNQTTYQRETGVLMKPTLDDKLPSESFIDLSFDSNNANSMYDALVDLNTANAVRQISGFFNSDSFKNIVPNIDDRKILKGRVNLFIRNIRNKNPYDNDEFAKAIRGLQNLAALGAGRALAGPTQALKQTIPVIANTIVNAGSIDLAAPFNEAKTNFINNSGYAIANRSAASINQIETLNKLSNKVSVSLPSKIADPFLQLNEVQLKLFLQKPDAYVARAAWITYYEKSLKQQGIDTKSIDYATHELNDKAADYAQRQVDRQQNISDMDLTGKFIGSKNALAQFVNKTIMPFSSFRINQSARLGSDWAVLTSKISTKEDKVIAARSLGGFFVELATFRAVSATISVVLASFAALISGKEDDEEDREKLFDTTIKGATTSSIIDIVSFLPYMDGIFQAGIAKSLDVAQDMLEVEDADKFPFYDPREKSVLEGLGMLGIAGQRAAEFIELIDVAYTRDYKDDFGRTKYISEEDSNILKNFVLINILSSVGIASPEIKTMTRRTLANVKRRSTTNESGVKEKKKSSGGGGSSRGGGMNKTDMKKYNPELYNQMYGPGSAGYEVEQQVKEFEKEQREFKKKMKDQLYGGKD